MPCKLRRILIGCQRFYHSSDCSERSHYTVVVVVAELAVTVMPLSIHCYSYRSYGVDRSSFGNMMDWS